MIEVAACVFRSTTTSPVPSVTFVTPTLSLAGVLIVRMAIPGATTVTVGWISITGGVLSKSEAKRLGCSAVTLVLDIFMILSYLPGSSAAFAEGESNARSGRGRGAPSHTTTGPLPSSEQIGRAHV